MEGGIIDTAQEPDEIRRSGSDPDDVNLYDRWYTGTEVGDKYMCVVVRMHDADAFVVTAYLTDRIKRGEVVWTARQ